MERQRKGCWSVTEVREPNLVQLLGSDHRRWKRDYILYIVKLIEHATIRIRMAREQE